MLTDNALNGNPAMQAIPLGGMGTKETQDDHFRSATCRDLRSQSNRANGYCKLGLPVTFTSQNSVCMVSGTSVTIQRAGTCTITATQAGNADYQEAKVQNIFMVTPATLTVTADNVSQSLRHGDTHHLHAHLQWLRERGYPLGHLGATPR